MKILIAPDSFKNCLSAEEVAYSIKEGFSKVFPQAEYTLLPLSDGGEGIVNCFITNCKGKRKPLKVMNPYGTEIPSYYGLYGNNHAIIESALASGIQLVQQEELCPVKASSYGTGQLIWDAIQYGCKKITIGIGGTATNDGGIGMAEALGFLFLNKEKEVIKAIPENLMDIEDIIFPDHMELFQKVDINIASDVKNPLLGKHGATYTFGKQKGATEEDLAYLEKGLSHLAEITANKLGRDYSKEVGAGAAGGLGFALMAFIGAEMHSGFKVVSKEIGLEEALKDTHLIITGEGKIDSQTHFGKLPFAIGSLAKKRNKRIIAICGTLAAKSKDPIYDTLPIIVPITEKPVSLEEAIKNAKKLIKRTSKRIALMLQMGMQF